MGRVHTPGRLTACLCDQLGLLEFAIDQRHIPMLVELGAPQAQLVGMPHDPAQCRALVHEGGQGRQIIGLQPRSCVLATP